MEKYHFVLVYMPALPYIMGMLIVSKNQYGYEGVYKVPAKGLFKYDVSVFWAFLDPNPPPCQQKSVF